MLEFKMHVGWAIFHVALLVVVITAFLLGPVDDQDF